MAEKLGAQFNSLNALIELDKAILSSLDINLIIEIVLHRLNDTAHFSSPGFLLIDRPTPSKKPTATDWGGHRGLQPQVSGWKIFRTPKNHPVVDSCVTRYPQRKTLSYGTMVHTLTKISSP